MPRHDDDRYTDEYDRPRRRPPASDNGGSIAVKILAILGAVAMVVVLVCGGLLYYVFYSIKQGAQHVSESVSQAVEQQKEQFERDQQEIRKRFEEEQKKAAEQRAKEEQLRKEQQARAQEEHKQKVAEKRKATQFANAFITEAKAGRTADAYAMTSAAYRKRVSQAQFNELIREHTNTLGALRLFRDVVIVEHDLEPPFTYSETRAAQGGFKKVEVTVAKEGGDWKVDQLFIGMYDPFGK
jgi:hypothetical protein